jgi:signal transduction histidine kinase
MKRQISLKLFVTLAFLSLAVVLVIGYSLLSAHYYHLGMSSITASNMEEAARSYLELVPASRQNHLNTFRGYSVAGDWEHMPPDIRKLFNTPPVEPGFIMKRVGSSWLKPPDLLYFLYTYRDNQQTLFVSRHGSRESAPPLIGRNAAESQKMLFAISISIAGVLGIVILLLLRRVSKPVTALGQWARSLNSENLNQPPPDFSYPELNELAGLIRTSLSTVQESLEREHSFLRHASHELRTPIAIVRNNVELLHKLENNPERIAQRRQVVDRIDRAGHTMQHLTETLLWLSRDDVDSLPARQLELNSLLQELVDEMKYLLNRKNIELVLKTNPCTIFLPPIPARVVLGNLIRNAFQHSWEGCITIYQRGNRVLISNPQSPDGNDQNELGFGLGLQLTAQLSTKLGWMYTDESEKHYRIATITLNSTVSSQESSDEPQKDSAENKIS